MPETGAPGRQISENRLDASYAYITKAFAVDEDGRYHAWKKGVGDCDIDLAKATAFEVEGTMTCPKGLLDEQDKPAKPILDVKFKAKADSTAPVKSP